MTYPDVQDENPYPTPTPIPYNPEETVLPDPVDAPPPPEREHMTAKEANEKAAADAQSPTG